MLERQRHREVLRALAEHNVLTIKQMTELLGVSEATVRGKTRCGARLVSTANFSSLGSRLVRPLSPST
ncbi:MAG: DeoR family transcriptional regulator [Proteobacteria bacterium]|nr:DeoR family transcriptional regulator [Pseudomonadota bacterium]